MTPFVPCPACGGPVHPIAGRCKHCKTDLQKMRDQYAQAARAASMGVPPPMHLPPQPAGPATETMVPRPAERAPTPAPVMHAAVYAHGYGTAMPSSWSRRWPLLVGGAAILVIAISLVILFRGNADGATSTTTPGTSRSPRPIPDDMNTPRGPLGQNAPTPDPIDPIPDPIPSPPRPGQRTTPTDPTTFMVAVVETLCQRAADCGASDPTTKMFCSQVGSMGSIIDPDLFGGGQQCTIDQTLVTACFDAINNMSCDAMGDINQLLSGSNTFSACTAAAQCI